MTADEAWAFGGYYVPSFACCAFVTAVTGAWCLLARRQRSGHLSLGLMIVLLGLPLFVWLAYFAMTAKTAYAITSLDTEDDALAEVVYKTYFDVDLHHAVKLAIDKSQTGNVRFYASCRIADLLRANNDKTRGLVLRSVRGAPDFRTGFFGTNDLTCGLFTPNYAEGPFTVSGIIEKRLELFGSADDKGAPQYMQEPRR